MKRKSKDNTDNVGKVFRGVTKYIDPETKRTRNYVVLEDNEKRTKVAKLKSIKQTDPVTGKNIDPALAEINQEKYKLKRRTGVDFQRFKKNRIKNQRLRLDDKDVFPKGSEEFRLSERDTNRVLHHTGIIKNTKKKKKS